MIYVLIQKTASHLVQLRKFLPRRGRSFPQLEILTHQSTAIASLSVQRRQLHCCTVWSNNILYALVVFLMARRLIRRYAQESLTLPEIYNFTHSHSYSRLQFSANCPCHEDAVVRMMCQIPPLLINKPSK
jgi:predicted ABC-class ATPase